MNKILSITLSSVLILSLIFSCSEDKVEKMDKQNEISAKEIGEYHNIAVDLFMKYKSNKKRKNFTTIEMQEVVTTLMKENYPDLMKAYTKPSIE
ncbi:MAG: hypothetical protein KGV44_14280, partial [Flavobacteriaceae bacterium]|nr:hypothetical protein [Flavobacteriaceae bacterium]